MSITRLGSYGQLKGSSYKLPCRLATTSTVNLSSPPSSIDGITTAIGDRILAWNQSSEAENGIYIVSVSSWSRDVDFSIDDDVINGIQVYINEGDTNSKKIFVLENTGVITLGTTPLVFNPILGGFQSLVIQVTKTQVDALIDANSLVPGVIYKITGVHSELYNDGTESGTTVFLHALTNNKLSIEGSGLFYNPKYNQSINEYGIWSNRSTWTATVTGGTFSANEAVIADNGATGQLVGPIDSNIFISTGGTWSEAVTITGENSGATASVSDVVLKSYSVDDTVIWGGYVWVNLNGNVGDSIGSLSLNEEWSKIQYDETYYNISLDIIHYDYENDIIVYREDIAANIVHTTKAFNDLYNEPIKLFQWGNNFKYGYDEGVGNNLVKNSICNNVNFSGEQFIDNEIIDSSFGNNIIASYSSFSNNKLINSQFIYNTLCNSSFTNNTLSVDSNFTYNALSNSTFTHNNLATGSTFISNTLSDGSYFNYNNLSGGSSFSSNTLSSLSYFNSNSLNSLSNFNNNTLSGSSFSQNLLSSGSSFDSNTLSDSSDFVNNTLSSSYFSSNTLSGDSSFSQNSLSSGSYFDGNSLDTASNFSQNSLSSGSSFDGNSLDTASFNNNSLSSGSYFDSNSLTASNFSQNSLNSSTLTSTTQLVSKTIQNLTMEKGIVNEDISTAIIIFQDFSRTVYNRPDGTPKIRYCDDADAIIIADITD